MITDDELSRQVLHAVYGLAKGRANVSVKVADIAVGTGLDQVEVAGCVETLAQHGLIIMSEASGRTALLDGGMKMAKADAERHSDVVFAD